MELQLRIAGLHHELLKRHLLPAAGHEAVAVCICGRFSTASKTIITVHEVTLIPYDECNVKEPDLLQWSTQRIIPYFERIGRSDMALLKIHSHPGGYNAFSSTDDKSDHEFFDSVFGWSINDKPHASAVMLPDGAIFGRCFFHDLHHEAIDLVSIAGDELLFFPEELNTYNSDFALRTIQAFGDFTYSKLQRLKVGVVGCSGTGSPLIEQLVRLGVGKIVLIDPDKVEIKNLNRILNSTRKDAEDNRFKVEVLKDAIERTRIGTDVTTYTDNLYDSIECLRDLVTCDVVFGCMDSVDGRHILNQLCSFYIIPYFDLGVKLQADGQGGIEKICGSVHYIQPGCSSLLTRSLYTIEDLRAASQLRTNKQEYEDLLKNAYIKNVNVNSPAVISINMNVSSHAVNEFLNRLHPYKSELPSNYALSTIDFSEGYVVNVKEEDFEYDNYLRKKLGRGDVIPFIEMPEILP